MDYECDSTLAELKKRFPAGALVELVKMEDKDSPPKGTKGEVLHVDAWGTVHVLWETGSTLGIIPSVDEIRLVSETLGDCMDETIKAQLEQVRNSALTNMFDVAAVISIAKHLGLDELAAYLAAGNTGEYTRFILTGKT